MKLVLEKEKSKEIEEIKNKLKSSEKRYDEKTKFLISLQKEFDEKMQSKIKKKNIGKDLEKEFEDKLSFIKHNYEKSISDLKEQIRKLRLNN